jgi:phosphate-selective porin
VRRYKFKLSGKVYDNWKYKLQMNFAGTGDAGRDALEDAYVQYTRNRMAQVWIGQGKAFFGRQELTSSGKQQFVDRSIANSEFAPGRDIGVGLVGVNESKTFEYNVGAYNGNGRNETSNDNDSYMYVGRLVFTPFGAYKPEESSLDYPEDPRLAIGVSGMMNTFTDMGVDLDETTLGVEAAFKVLGFNTVAEYFSKTSDLAGGGDVDTDGGYLQLGYLFPNRKFELAGRHALVEVDGGEETTETGVAASYYIAKHRYKVQGDYRVIDREIADTEDGEFRVQLQIQF